MRSPSEPASTDTVQDQGGRGTGPFSGSLLVPPRSGFQAIRTITKT